jgi:hypothetical protein
LQRFPHYQLIRRKYSANARELRVGEDVEETVCSERGSQRHARRAASRDGADAAGVTAERMTAHCSKHFVRRRTVDDRNYPTLLVNPQNRLNSWHSPVTMR